MNRKPNAGGMLEAYFRDIIDSTPLSHEREVELAERVRAGDMGARDELVQANLRYVISVAKHYQHRGLSLEELISAGNVGLMEAARRFDHTRGFKFITYAVWWIRQAIQQELGAISAIRVPASRLDLLRRIRRVQTDDTGVERRLTPEEIAGAVGTSVDMVRETLANATSIASLDDSEGGEGQALLDVVPDSTTEAPDSALSAQEERAAVEEILGTLVPREALVLKLYYGLRGEEPMTLEQIGAHLRLTRERARQIKELALQRLRNPARVAFLASLLGDNESALLGLAERNWAAYCAKHEKTKSIPAQRPRTLLAKR